MSDQDLHPDHPIEDGPLPPANPIERLVARLPRVRVLPLTLVAVGYPEESEYAERADATRRLRA